MNTSTTINAKAVCLEPNADGLPDMQIITHDKNAAHSGLLPLVPALP
jgi:hypothetical protein